MWRIIEPWSLLLILALDGWHSFIKLDNPRLLSAGCELHFLRTSTSFSVCSSPEYWPGCFSETKS